MNKLESQPRKLENEPKFNDDSIEDDLDAAQDVSVPRGLMDNIRHNFKSNLNFNQQLNTIFKAP